MIRKIPTRSRFYFLFFLSLCIVTFFFTTYPFVEYVQQDVVECHSLTVNRVDSLIKQLEQDNRNLPQLTNEQIQWISGYLYCEQKTTYNPTLLVFGLGYDSIVWKGINPHGRTIFLEDDKEWIQKITSDVLDLEVYAVNYNTTLEHAQEHLENPIEVELPNHLIRLCPDVVLIDGPKGYQNEFPGRFQPAFYALKQSRWCIKSGLKKNLVVFLHDSSRDVEQQIIKRFFDQQPDIDSLGLKQGTAGKLAGFYFH
jgi:hypothetical protein